MVRARPFGPSPPAGVNGAGAAADILIDQFDTPVAGLDAGKGDDVADQGALAGVLRGVAFAGANISVRGCADAGETTTGTQPSTRPGQGRHGFSIVFAA